MAVKRPYFSIIIPTYERSKPLEACLKSIQQINYPKDCFEVIVVDDGSKEPPTHVLKRYQTKINARLVKQAHGGPAKARNRGANHATGQFLAFTDDDCLPKEDWLQKFEAVLSEMKDVAVGGSVINGLEGNPYAEASQHLVDYLYKHYNVIPTNACFLATNNLAVPRDQFLKMGGFDSSFIFAGGEDREFCQRWMNHGYGMVYHPEAQVFHYHRLTPHSFVKQQFNYGRGAFHYRKKTSGPKWNRNQLESTSFHLQLMAYPFRESNVHRKLSIGLLFIVSQLVIAGGFLREWLCQGVKDTREASIPDVGERW